MFDRFGWVDNDTFFDYRSGKSNPPRFWGVAWSYPQQNTLVLPIPLNVIFNKARRIWRNMKGYGYKN